MSETHATPHQNLCDPAPQDRAAFDRTAPLRAALDLGQAPPYALDAMYAGSQALGIARRLAPYRDQIAALPGFDATHLDHLADTANALQFVQWTLVARAERVRQLPALAEQGYQIRTLLLAYAEVLVLKGKVSAEVVKRLRDGSGYRDLLEDLGALVQLLRAHVDGAQSGAPVSVDDLERAQDVVAALNAGMAAASDPDLGHDTLMVERRKLAVLLLRAQAQLRRAMDYLRFDQKDAADLVPTLYVPRRPGSSAAAEPDPVVASPPVDPTAPPSAPQAVGADSPFES